MKEEKKIIPLKNYIETIFLFLATIIVVIALSKWHQSYQEYNLKIPVISGKIQEIKIDELDDYMTEHDDFFLYICVSEDKICRNVEKELPELLESRNIKNNTIYINANNIENKVLTKLNNYGYEKEKINLPIFLIFNNKKAIISVEKDSNNFTIDDIEKLLDEYEVNS